MARSAPDDAAQAGLLIAHALQAAGFSHALGGALALGAHGVPRGTLDVDVNVFVPEAEVPRVIDCLQGLGVAIDKPGALARAGRDGMFVGSWSGMRIDVFVPSIPFSAEAANKRVLLTSVDGESAWFLAAESLAVFKLMFFRPKDLADLERLVAIQGSALDRGYVRTWIADMMGDQDERVRAWDDLCRRF